MFATFAARSAQAPTAVPEGSSRETIVRLASAAELSVLADSPAAAKVKNK